ncbi:uncharacterized protein LOC144040512 isoform X6 [Vanacampus margaritifer]
MNYCRGANGRWPRRRDNWRQVCPMRVVSTGALNGLMARSKMATSSTVFCHQRNRDRVQGKRQQRIKRTKGCLTRGPEPRKELESVKSNHSSVKSAIVYKMNPNSVPKQRHGPRAGWDQRSCRGETVPSTRQSNKKEAGSVESKHSSGKSQEIQIKLKLTNRRAYGLRRRLVEPSLVKVSSAAASCGLKKLADGICE